jgi:multidrug efflux system membrane fusion protein
MAEAAARLARNQALLEKAKVDAERYAGLVKQDYVTKEQYDQTVTNVAALMAQISADEATLETARLNLSFCTISAPVAGRTGSLLIKAGNLIRTNDERTLVTINQTSPIYVTFSVPSQYLAQVQGRTRDRLEVAAFAPERTDQRQTGRLSFVDNAVDMATNTIQLKATFVNDDEALWPGQFVSVVLNLGDEPDRVAAPAAAVQTGQQGQYVFVIGADGTATQQVVTVERQNETEAVITSGLNGGETVVVEGHLRVVPGGRVRVSTPGAKPAAGTAPAGEAAR